MLNPHSAIFYFLRRSLSHVFPTSNLSQNMVLWSNPSRPVDGYAVPHLPKRAVSASWHLFSKWAHHFFFLTEFSSISSLLLLVSIIFYFSFFLNSIKVTENHCKGEVLVPPCLILLTLYHIGRMPKARQVLRKQAHIQHEILDPQESCFVMAAIVFQ